MRFTAAVTHEPPWYVACCLEVEVTSQGESVEEALSSLSEASRALFRGSAERLTMFGWRDMRADG